MIDLSGDDSPEPEPEEQEEPPQDTGEGAGGAGEGPSGVSRHDTPGELGLATAINAQAAEQPGSTVASTVAALGREDLKRRRDSDEEGSEEREGKRQETEEKA